MGAATTTRRGREFGGDAYMELIEVLVGLRISQGASLILK